MHRRLHICIQKFSPINVSRAVSRLIGTSNSDALVGIQHNSQGGTERSGRQVLGKLGSHHAVVSVAGDNFSPTAFEVGCSLGVLGFPDISDTLAVVELA